MALISAAVWTIAPELVVALDARLGPPVDSYLNGSQVWLVEENAPVTLEFRMHPVARYQQPKGCSHYDIWESVVAQLSQDADAHALRVGSEVRPLSSFWDGLECFAAYGDEIEPAALTAAATALLERKPDRSGLVDHERVGDAWEHEGGAVSIVALLLEELNG